MKNCINKRVSVSITTPERYCKWCLERMDGKTGTIIKKAEDSFNGHPSPGVAYLVEFDTPTKNEFGGEVVAFWFPPCDILF